MMNVSLCVGPVTPEVAWRVTGVDQGCETEFVE